MKTIHNKLDDCCNIAGDHLKEAEKMSDTECNLRAKNQMLLPCPFCGGNAHLAWYNVSEKQIVAECENPFCLSAVCGAKTAEEAIMRWNRRAAASELKACPFCGGRGELEHFNNGECEMYEVRCKNPHCHAETSMSSKAEDVIKIWNKRMKEEGEEN